MAQRSTAASRLNAWSFFMRLLQNRIGVGNQGPRLAQPEAELSKHPLALTHAQPNPVMPGEPGLEAFPVPQRSAQADLARRTAQHRLHLLELPLAQALGPSGPRPFRQSGQTALFKMSNPVFDRPRSISQQPACLRAGHPLRHEQHPVQAVIVARFFRTADLVLKSQNHGIGISNGEWFHAPMKPHLLTTRNYL